MDKMLYSQKEVADYFRVSIQSISVWIKDGLLKRAQTGQVRIPYQEILNLLELKSMEPLYDRKEIANMLGVTVSCIDKWLSTGKIKPIQKLKEAGRVIRIPESEINRICGM